MILWGGAGDDRLNGGKGNDSIEGGAGSDTILGGAGNDTLHGSNDWSATNDKGDVVDGGSGNDMISARWGATVKGGTGIDHLTLNLLSESGNFKLNLAAKGVQSVDSQTKVSGFESLNYAGGSGEDVISGANRSDSIAGGAGNDILKGLGGANSLTDGDGDDYLYGGAGNDYLFRNDDGTGRDRFFGDAGNDTLTFIGYTTSVILDLAQQSKNDGQAKGLTVNSIETFIGSYNDDEMSGDKKGNHLSGGYGDDILNGRAGNDTLIGGEGDDWLTGGAGADRFVFDYASRGNDGDIITDFTRGSDKLVIDFSAYGITEIKLLTGANPTAKGTTGIFLFETDNGRLWFDADGAGDYAEAEFIALLEDVKTLKVSDFDSLY